MSVAPSNAAFDIVPWNPSFETGVAIIDQQHRQLVKLLNDLAHQYVYGLEPDQLERIIDGLVEYTVYHFDTEEALWADVFADDEWFTRHQRSHNGFVEKVRSLQRQASDDAGLSTVDDLLSFLVSWLAHHILHDDKSMSVVLLEVDKGRELAAAKDKSIEAMSGEASGLIRSVLAMYKQLSGRTLALQREAYARELAEHKLREQEAHWQSVLGAIHDALWDWNLASIDADDPSSTRKLFAGKGQSIHPDDWPGLREAFLAHLTGQTETFSHQHRVLDSDRNEHWIQSRGKVIAHDAQGRPARIVGTQTDITERITQEQVLQRERDTRLLISEFAADFMASSPEEFDAAIERALQRAGQYMGADRTYIFLASDDGRHMSNTHEWCAPGVEPEMQALPHIAVDSMYWWWDQLRTNGYVLIPRVADMPAEAHRERSILEARNALSVCAYPLYTGDRLVGFLGNSAVKEEHDWGPEVLEFLDLMSDLVGIALGHRQLQCKRAEALTRLERAEQLAHLGHWRYDFESDSATWSKEVFRIYERNAAALAPGHEAYFAMIHPEDRKRVHESFVAAKQVGGSLHTEHRVVLTSGKVKYVEVRGRFQAGPDGQPVSVEGTVQDISEKAHHREELRMLAYEDSLTGLPNRRALEQQLQQEIEYCHTQEQTLVLALLDLDNFRAANERHGPAVGDDVLVALSQRMRRLFAKPAMVGRISGDGFLVLLPRLAKGDDYFPALRRLLATINEPLRLGDIELSITASMGVTEYPQRTRVSGEHLLRQAQQALFEAKMQGKNRFQKYDVKWEHNTQALTDHLDAIENGLAAHEFVLHYQPKVDMASGAVVGAEALIRWQKPNGELLPPAAFLPALQDHPLEVELGDWVIRSALSQMAAWQAEGLSVPVSVNVTSQQLLEDVFVEKLENAFADYPSVAPQALQIEILESSALQDLEKVSHVIMRCRELGVEFALDDFGTGFSSLSYLKHLPASVLKIDQSFVRGMLDTPDDLSIISGIVGMAKAFGLQVIAEGVETAEHGELLLRLGCQQGQGYGIARAMPAENLSGWIQSWKAPLSWSRPKPADLQGPPILYAEVEHRHWVKQLEAWLSGEADHTPVMDAHRCQLGQWVDNEGHAQFAGRPEFQALLEHHEALHQAGRAAIAARDKGEAEVARAILGDIYKERDRVVSALRVLGDSAKITG